MIIIYNMLNVNNIVDIKLLKNNDINVKIKKNNKYKWININKFKNMKGGANSLKNALKNSTSNLNVFSFGFITNFILGRFDIKDKKKQMEDRLREIFGETNNNFDQNATHEDVDRTLKRIGIKVPVKILKKWFRRHNQLLGIPRREFTDEQLNSTTNTGLRPIRNKYMRDYPSP